MTTTAYLNFFIDMNRVRDAPVVETKIEVDTSTSIIGLCDSVKMTIVTIFAGICPNLQTFK